MLKVYNWYLLAHYLHTKKIPFLPKVITNLIRLIFAAWIPHTARIGKGTVFGYGGLGIVIHGRAVIGKECHIDQNVTIGGTSKITQVPVLGDRVYLGAGAKVLGPVTIGNEVVIGANAVVLSDIPDGCVAVGIPARVVKRGIKMADYV